MLWLVLVLVPYTAAQSCPPGRYTAASDGSRICLPCLAGTYCPGERIPPLPCPSVPGANAFYCPAGAALPLLCPADSQCSFNSTFPCVPPYGSAPASGVCVPPLGTVRTLAGSAGTDGAGCDFTGAGTAARFRNACAVTRDNRGMVVCMSLTVGVLPSKRSLRKAQSATWLVPLCQDSRTVSAPMPR